MSPNLAKEELCFAHNIQDVRAPVKQGFVPAAQEDERPLLCRRLGS